MKKYICYVTVFVLGVMPSVMMSATVQAVSVRPLIITEMMPGTSTSASQEFIELYNQSAEPIDLASQGWALEIATSKATTWDKAKNVALNGVVQPGGYALVASSYKAAGQDTSYLAEYALAQFSSGLTGGSGHIRLIRTTDGVKQTMDQLEWSTLANGIPVSDSIDSVSIMRLTQSLDADQSLKRVIAQRVFSDQNDNAVDYLMSLCPSPTSYNVPNIPAASPVPTTIDSDDQTCVLLPEAPDYEPIPIPTDEPPATLLPAPTGTSSVAGAQPKIPAGNAGLLAPQLTELLPNPGSPQTDVQDEFIELYNPNQSTYDLSGYVLRIGINGTKKYTFPVGTTLAPKSFTAFYSADTHISLSNSGGRVVLQDPLERTLDSTKEYATAKDGVAWARATGTWHWTSKPTPNAPNTISAPPATAKKTASKSSSSKSTATNTAKRTTAPQPASLTQEDPPVKSPIHPLALAVVGGFALLYGAYEYRRDMANAIYKFRVYRAARRADRS